MSFNIKRHIDTRVIFRCENQIQRLASLRVLTPRTHAAHPAAVLLLCRLCLGSVQHQDWIRARLLQSNPRFCCACRCAVGEESESRQAFVVRQHICSISHTQTQTQTHQNHSCMQCACLEPWPMRAFIDSIIKNSKK